MKPKRTAPPSGRAPIATWDEIDSVLSHLSATHPGKRLFYRGQNHLHPSIRSGRARPNAKISKDVEAGWRSLASRVLGPNDPRFSDAYGLALLQHYGMATHFVDLTDNVKVAAWFASNTFSTQKHIFNGTHFRKFENAQYTPVSDGNGYIIVLAIPEEFVTKSSDRLIDLSQLPSSCARPHKQRGWLLLDRPPTEPTPNSFWIDTIKINCRSLPNDLSTDDLFPGPEDDPAYSEFLSVPFVQTPFAYFRQNKSAKSKKISDKLDTSDWCFASRAILVPEYSGINHTWSDFTIYEPHPMRMWKYWSFDLAAMHQGAKGNIRDAAKVTLTPEAYKALDESNCQNYAWPDLGSDGIFFTFACLDHDKVIEHCPPYYGVWLQRDDDLIIESPMEADRESLCVCPGHAYFLKNGTIRRQGMNTACGCGNTNSHDQRTRAMLRLSALL